MSEPWAGNGIVSWAPIVRGEDGRDLPIPWCFGDTPEEARELYDSLNETAIEEEGHGLPPLLRIGRVLITPLND